MSSKIRSTQRAREQKQQPGIITLKLNQLIGSQVALGTLMNQPLPARQAFELGKTVKAVNGELEAYETTRKALCDRLSGGKMKNGGKEYDIPADKLEGLHKELADLMESEVELPVKLINIESLNGIQISASHMMQLEWLIAD